MNHLFINTKHRDISLFIASNNCIVYITPFKINKLWKKINLLYFNCPPNIYSLNLDTLHSLQLNISLNCQSIHNNENYESHFIIPVTNAIDTKISYYANQHFNQSVNMKKTDVNIIERLEIRLHRSDNHEEIINNFDFEFLLEFSE